MFTVSKVNESDTTKPAVLFTNGHIKAKRQANEIWQANRLTKGATALATI